MIQPSIRCERLRRWALALLVSGCAAHAPARFETTSALPDDEPRRPAGLALDPEPELPPAAPSGPADATLLVLEAPGDLNAARGLVRRFFDAVLAENFAELEALLADQASVELDPQSGKRRASAVWRARLDQLDYDRLAAQELYRESELESYRKSDVDGFGNRGYPKLDLGDDDVVLRVRLLVTKLDKVSVFGSEIVFVLRPVGTSYKIAEMIEHVQLQ